MAESLFCPYMYTMIYMALCTEGLGKKCTEITITTETPRSSLILGGGGGGGGGGG